MLQRKKKPDLLNNSEKLISSGSDMLDLALGGGFGIGKVVNIIGDKSTGKTLLAIECIAKARKQFGDKFHFYYNDAENGFSFNTQKMYGFEIIPPVDPDENSNKQSSTVEQLIHNLSKAIHDKPKDEPMVYVVDSIDSLSCDAEIKRSEERCKAIEAGKVYDQGSYNLEKQRLLNEFFRVNINEIGKCNVTLILISQIRQKMGVVFGDKTTRQCAQCLDFYSAQVIQLKEIEKLKKTLYGKDHTIGIATQAYIKKNKLAVPFKSVEMEILFEHGVDNISSNLNYLYDLTTDGGKAKKKIDVSWKEQEFTSRETLIQFIGDNKQASELKAKVKDKWTSILTELIPKRIPKYEEE